MTKNTTTLDTFMSKNSTTENSIMNTNINNKKHTKDENKNTSQIRYQEFTDEWNQDKLIDVCNYVDYRGKTPYKTDKGIFLITAKNVKKGYIDYEASKEYISEEDYQEVMHRGLPKIGDVLITTEAPFGNVAQIDKENIALAQRVIKYRGKKDVIDNSYLTYYLLSPEFQRKLYSISSGGTVKGVKGSILHKQKIKYPSLPEQQQIGQFFKKIDQQITAQQEKIQHHKQQKKALLQQMFPQGDSSMPSVRYPGYDDEWSECKLNNILTLLKDGTHETHKDSSEGCLLLSAKNIKNGKIFWNKTDRIISIEDYNKIHKNFKLQQGDVLLTIVGSIGETAILKNPENITFQRSVAYLRPDKSKLTAEYLNIVIQTRQFQNELDKRKAISAQPGIYLKDLRKIRVKIPSLPEQQQIGQFFQKIDQQIQLNQNKLEDMKQMKKGLMQRMFV